MYQLKCNICGEIYQNQGYLMDFIMNHIHDNFSELECQYCHIKWRFEKRITRTDQICDPITKNIISKTIYLNTEQLVSFWETHLCKKMALQDLAIDEYIQNQQDNKNIKNDYYTEY